MDRCFAHFNVAAAKSGCDNEFKIFGDRMQASIKKYVLMYTEPGLSHRCN